MFKVKYVFLGFLFVVSANGQTVAPSAVTATPGPPRFPYDSCKEDIAKMCASENEERGITRCLYLHDSSVSESCKQSLQRMLQMSKQAASRGGGALGSFGGMSLTAATTPSINYGGTLVPDSSGPALGEERLNVSTPIFKSAENSLAMSVAGANLHFNDPITLNSGTVVPTNFYRAEIGGQFTHQLGDKKNWGLRGSVGYISDKPFQNISDTTFSVNGSYGFPGDGNGYWILTVFLSNNSSLLNYIPIPGVIYMYRSEHFTGLFGFPILSMQWTPIEPWAFSLSLFGPTVNGEIAYGNVDRIQSFLGVTWTQQSYIRAARTQLTDRLTLDEKKIFLGLRSSLFLSVVGELQAGLDFDRSIYEGKGVFNRDRGSASLASSWFTTWNVRASF